MMMETCSHQIFMNYKPNINLYAGLLFISIIKMESQGNCLLAGDYLFVNRNSQPTSTAP